MDRLASINGLRGIAILLVMSGHYGVFDALLRDPAWMRSPFAALVTNTWSGVNLFFVLSGFVLFLPYAQGRRRLGSAAEAMEFLRRRGLRLLPLHYLAACVGLALVAGSMDGAGFAHAAWELLSFAFVTQRYGFMPVVNPPLWSLGVEVVFSLGFPVVVLACTRIGMARVLALALAGSLAMRILGRIWSHQLAGPNFLADNIFGRLDEFVIGMAIAQAYARDSIPPWAPRLLAPGVALIAAAWLGFHYSIGVVPPRPSLSLLNNVLDAGLAAVLLALLQGCKRANAVLASPALQVPGMMCYSLYVWHVLILTHVAPGQGRLVALLLTIAIAGLTYRYIEFRNVADWRALFLIPRRPAARHGPPP